MRKALWVLVIGLALVGCSSEGGVTGTGISAIVAGNVSSVDGETPRSGIEVSIESAERISAVTDESGNFELTGSFAGEVSVRFRRDSNAMDLGDLRLVVPAGSTTLLEDVVIDRNQPQGVRVTVVRQGAVVGVISSAVCNALAGVLELALDAEDQRVGVRLSDTTIIRRANGGVLECEDLRIGDRVEATGVLLSNGRRLASRVVITERAARPRQEFDVEFGGSVNGFDCARNRIRVLVRTAPESFVATVRIDRRSELVCSDGESPSPCSCEDINVGDVIQVRGVASVANPEAVVAASILVLAEPAIVELPVEVLRVGCNQGKIETEARFETENQVIVARFNRQTDFVCSNEPCRCADIRAGDLLVLVGRPVVMGNRPFIDAAVIVRPAGNG